LRIAVIRLGGALVRISASNLRSLRQLAHRHDRRNDYAQQQGALITIGCFLLQQIRCDLPFIIGG
jgi:hypothetical protein